ncbi:unnamed protein product, partial [Ectocarpus fasciculatus]
GDDNTANSHAAPDSGTDPDDDGPGTNPDADNGPNSHATPDGGTNPDDRTGTKVKTRRRLPPTRPPPPTPSEIEKLPSHKIDSCGELSSNRTRMEGVLLITDDIVCQKDRVLEVTDELIILSEKPVLYLEGVRFLVKENAKLRFGVSTIRVERLEGVTGAIFTVEPQGYVGLHVNKQGPVTEDGFEVGEELRFPSSMTTLDGGHTMTMGVDGSLLLSGSQRYEFFRDEMVQGVEKQLDTDTFVSGLNPDYDGVDPRGDLKVLAAASDPAQAMRSFHGRRQRFERSKVLEDEERQETADVVAEMERKLEEFVRERKKMSDLNKEQKENKEDDDEEEKVPPQQPESTAQAGRRSGSSSGKTKGGRATDSESEEGGSGTSTSSSSNDDESEATAAVPKSGPSSPPPPYFGDDMVLQVTKTGDVVRKSLCAVAS